MAIDGVGADSWLRRAMKNPALVAGVLLSFRGHLIPRMPWNCRLDRDPVTRAFSALAAREPLDSGIPDAEDDDRPSTSAAAVELPDWGRRTKRSRLVGLAGIRDEAAETKRKKALGSPRSPLVIYSSASMSGASGDGEEGTSSPESLEIVPTSLGASCVVVADCRGDSPAKVEDKQHVMPHLRIAGQGLLGCLVPKKAELEDSQKSAERLKEPNRVLQFKLELPKEPNTDGATATVVEVLQFSGPPPAPDRFCGKKLILPDLNELPDLDAQPNCAD